MRTSKIGETIHEDHLGRLSLRDRCGFRLIDRLRANGIAILLSEQNAQMTLAIADRAYVIETGSIALQARGRELLGRPEIAERYLGIGGDSASANRRDAEGRHARLVRGLADIFSD